MATMVELQQAEGVARVRFGSENGIQLLDASARKQLKGILDEISKTDVRIVVFEATGRTFLAGADIQELKALTRATARKYSRSGQRLFQKIADLPALTVAAVHAACVGGGCELALACDVRLAASGARIGLPEVTLGLIPGWGGTARSRVLLGQSAAHRIVLSGELFLASTAQSLGLVHEVISDEGFREAVDARIAQWRKAAPQALATAKTLLDRATHAALRKELTQESRAFASCFETAEAAEGLAAFLEKRPAAWCQM